jgi:hypothetical protein
MAPRVPRKPPTGVPAWLLAAAFFCFQFLPTCPAWSTAAAREIAGPLSDIHALAEDSEARAGDARAGEDEGGQDACRSLPEEEDPFRRAPGPTLRSRLGSVQSGSPAPPAACDPLLPGSGSSLVLSNLPGRPAGPRLSALPYPGRYPVFLFADLPPPSLS